MNNNSILNNCKLCIRNCNVNRESGDTGFCKSGANAKIARAALHFWEEPCISGTNGSGTIFFSNCNLRCVFCQNHIISHTDTGTEISTDRLASIFLELQAKGAHNINLVTPTHFVPQIINAITIARNYGLELPIIYNTNAYDTLDTIKKLNGYIDVYLPDYKYYDDKYSIKYSNAPSYSHNAICVIKEMISQVGNPIFKDGIIQKGVIVRHLMLPGLLFDSKKIVDLLYKYFGDSIYISFMNQYTPLFNASKFPEINKPLNSKHYESLINYALKIGVNNGFMQEEGTNSENYVPNFNNEGVF